MKPEYAVALMVVLFVTCMLFGTLGEFPPIQEEVGTAEVVDKYIHIDIDSLQNAAIQIHAEILKELIEQINALEATERGVRL